MTMLPDTLSGRPHYEVDIEIESATEVSYEGLVEVRPLLRPRQPTSQNPAPHHLLPQVSLLEPKVTKSSGRGFGKHSPYRGCLKKLQLQASKACMFCEGKPTLPRTSTQRIGCSASDTPSSESPAPALTTRISQSIGKKACSKDYTRIPNRVRGIFLN